MERYAPNSKDLGARDVVSRASEIEIREGRGCGPQRDHILLHLEHLEPGVLRARLPGISETAKIFAGVDVTREPIPVLPTAHYNMGGIPTNIHGEVLNPATGDPERSVPGLMAVGEAACVSVHGATRLGTNSLLDLLVFGRAAAERAAEILEPGAPHGALPPAAVEPAIARLDRIRHAKGGTKTGAIRRAMQRALQDHCAVFRTANVLEEGLRKMAEIARSLGDLVVADRSMIWNTDLVEALELDNLIGQAAVVLHTCTAREPGRPCPRGLPRARRRELAQARPRLARRCRPNAAWRPPRAPLPAVQRGPGLSAKRTGLLRGSLTGRVAWHQ
jgi:succinate dehydrogenase / fumarate reductase flavoprotein subunit